MPMKIVNYPHPALRAKCQPVTALDASVKKIAAEMLELMYRREGLGLAAPQVALDMQLICINFAGDAEKPDQEVVAINPVIVEQKGAVKDREGCLSFPGLYQDIRRAKTVKVQYYDLSGQLKEMTCSDLAARIWQHEIDHLNGVMFIDKMGIIAKIGSKKDLDQLVREFEEDVSRGLLPSGLEMKL